MRNPPPLAAEEPKPKRRASKPPAPPKDKRTPTEKLLDTSQCFTVVMPLGCFSWIRSLVAAKKTLAHERYAGTFPSYVAMLDHLDLILLEAELAVERAEVEGSTKPPVPPQRRQRRVE